ncbi:dienelactone hydrolase family protein [Nocardioides iriomotensis]|uniref:Dienelactone hydrolase n=1 Tax=Nocardioides iriomotensis TaxID=715784 RepID=A0A4Q5IWA4_9ACTN|nr:dienelactone hydrolase family protein [Nocardioides iriomotensis]RYU09408.1 dienelactone hydrolase [Nocardioides iriomotensis]
MTDIVLFHHAQGLTDGVRALAQTLTEAGHTVHTPDSYDGHTFPDLEGGLGYAREVGFGAVAERGQAAAAELPAEVVYVGISLGVMAAQPLAQQRPGCKGAVLIESCVPPEEFGGPWPDGVPVQVHGMDGDPIFAHEGDLDAAKALVGSVPDGELYLYSGDQHLFEDSSLPSYDADATRLLTERVLAFLARV